MRHFTNFRWVGATTIALGIFASIAAAQPPRTSPLDPIEAAKLQQRIAEQKAASDIDLTIKNADRLAKGRYTAKAIQTLTSAKQDIQLALGLSNATRTRLTAMLDEKLAAIEGRTIAKPNANPGILLDPKGTEVKDSKNKILATQTTEFKDVLSGIKLVEKCQLVGKNAEANAEVARLTKLYPSNPAVLALKQGSLTKNSIADAQAYYVEARNRWVANQMSINKSSLPAIRDTEFPANWKQLSEARLSSTRIKLTEKEKKIVEALDKPTTINFNERPLEEALQDLSTMFDVPFYVEKKSIEDLGLDLKRGVSLQGKGLSGRTVLRSILATQGLTFVVKNETIQVVTVERAQSLLTTRVYYIGDILQAGVFSGPEWGPAINGLQRSDNAKFLIDMVTKSIEPLMWRENGGPGTVTYHFPTQSLIVRASTEVHFALGRGFSGR